MPAHSTDAPTDDAPTADAIRATVRSYTERHTAGDIDGIVECFTADARIEDPVGSGVYEGPDAVRGFFVASHDLCDSMELTLTGPIRVAGRQAAFPMVVRSHIGDTTLELDIIDVMHFDAEAKVTEMHAYWNMDDARLTQD